MEFRFIDTHCHFDFPPFSGDETHSLELAQQQGVEALIVPTVSADRFDEVLSLSRRYPDVYAALGLHPIYLALHDESSLQKLADCLRQPQAKLVALGEIGLDSYVVKEQTLQRAQATGQKQLSEKAQMQRQLDLLESQLSLAKRHDLPVILHSRRTHDLLAKILRQKDLPRTGVIHGFSGSLEQAQAFIKLGYYIGVGGVITYDRAQKTRKAIAALPLSSLVLETDAPDMPVAGFQGQPNRPERLNIILSALSDIRTEPAQHLAEQIYLNTRRLFTLVA